MLCSRSSSLLAAIALLVSAHPAPAESFVFIDIADTTGGFSDFDGAPALNDEGTVAFYAALDAGIEGIFTGSVTTPANQTDAVAKEGDPSPSEGVFVSGFIRSGGVDPSFYTPAINAAGAVAFQARYQGGRGVYASDPASPGVVVKIADISTPGVGFLEAVSPGIEDDGSVVFSFPSTNGVAILRGTREDDLECVIGEVGRDSVGGLPCPQEPAFDSLSFPYRAGGSTAFQGHVHTGGEGVAAVPGGMRADSVNPSGGVTFSDFGQVTINALGQLGVGANLDSGESGVFLIDSEGSVATIDLATPTSVFRPPGLNDLGAVVYKNVPSGEVIAGGRRVIGDGDTLVFANSPVSGEVVTLDVSRGSLDSQGRVAFMYALADGTRGVAVAVPEGAPDLICEYFDYGPSDRGLFGLDGGCGWGVAWHGADSGNIYEPDVDLVWTEPGYANTDNGPEGGAIRPGNGVNARGFAAALEGTVWVSFLTENFPNTNALDMLLQSAGFRIGLDGTGAEFPSRPYVDYFGHGIEQGGVVGSGVKLVLAKVEMDYAGDLDRVSMWVDPPLLGGEAGLGPPKITREGVDVLASWPSLGLEVTNGNHFDALRIAHGDGTDEEKLRTVLLGVPTDLCEVETGAQVLCVLLGGVASPGGVTAILPDASQPGAFAASFCSVEAAALGSPELSEACGVDAGTLDFPLAGDPVSVWSLDFDGGAPAGFQLTFAYADPGFTESEEALLRIFHYEDVVTGCNEGIDCGWFPLLGAHDPIADTLTVHADDLSPFALPEPGRTPAVLAAWALLAALTRGSAARAAPAGTRSGARRPRARRGRCRAARG